MEYVGEEDESKTINGVKFGLNLATMFIDHSDTSWMDVVNNARVSIKPGWWK